MKFLVITQMRDPMAKIPEALVADIKKNMAKAKQDGTILSIHYMPGWNKAVSIEEHESAEALIEYCGVNYKYFNIEIYPLGDMDKALENLSK